MGCISNDNKEALALLFHRYARIVRGVAYKVLRDPAEADDMLQEIFLLVHRLAKNFDPSKSPARFWLLQMTYRRAISRRRYLSGRHFYDRLELEESGDQIFAGFGKSGRADVSLDEHLERKEMVQACFEELSEIQRQTLQLFFFEGYSLEEIAIRLGQTIGNTRHHYYRALDRLRKQIAASNLPGREGRAKCPRPIPCSSSTTRRDWQAIQTEPIHFRIYQTMYSEPQPVTGATSRHRVPHPDEANNIGAGES
jgi:RNA polymerase sigma-70 factor (ECF subfamily)